jgi:hypothetical protein
MRVGRYRRGGVGLSQEIDGDFSLWQEFVPKLHGKIISNTGKNAEKVGFEISDSHFGRVALIVDDSQEERVRKSYCIWK